MATVDELVTRAAKTGLYTEPELTAFRAALGPNAKPEEKEAALDGLVGKLEAAADKVRTATATNPATVNPAATANRPANATAAAANPTPPAPVTAPTVMTVDEYLATAPPLVQGVVRKAMAAELAAHAAMLATVRTAAVAVGYTEAELTAMSTEDLQRLANLSNIATPKMDYSGLGIVAHGQVPVEGRAAVVRPADAWEDELGDKRNKGKSAAATN